MVSPGFFSDSLWKVMTFFSCCLLTTTPSHIVHPFYLVFFLNSDTKLILLGCHPLLESGTWGSPPTPSDATEYVNVNYACHNVKRN